MAESETDRKLVLLIEDDPDLRRLTSIVLSERFDVDISPDGKSGIEKARESLPDLILLDIYMNGLSGFKVCRILKEDKRTSSIPVILFTAGAQRHEVSEGYASGADDYIIKPFETDDLLERIERLLSGSKD